jgi:hypothetical protein
MIDLLTANKLTKNQKEMPLMTLYKNKYIEIKTFD